jgi:acetyltransferase-like isoleucine patch superfamily enzyme
MNQLRNHTQFNLLNYIRYAYQKVRLAKFGKKIFIEKNVQLMRYAKNIYLDDNIILKEGVKICACNSTAEVHIGKNTSIGYNSYIFASDKIVIGDDCLIAPFVYIVDSDHGIKRDMKVNSQKNLAKPIMIGNDVWLASNVTILKGVTIGDGAVIAANSVVNEDVPSFSICAGSPAKKIGERL